MELCIHDIAGDTVFRHTEPCGSPGEIYAVIARLSARVAEEAKRLGIDASGYIGVGAAVAGVYDRKSHTLQACATAEWNGLDLEHMLQKAFGLPAYVENEANLYASQLLHSSRTGKGPQHVVYLHMGERIGAGVLADGKLLSGASGRAAEINHLPIGDPGVQCPYCGNQGCARRSSPGRPFCGNTLRAPAPCRRTAGRASWPLWNAASPQPSRWWRRTRGPWRTA